MTLTLTIQETPNGIALPDLTPRLTRASFSTNLHGDEALSVSSQLSLPRAFARYDRAGTPHAIVTDGANTPFQGRVEDTTVNNAGLDLTAFGYQRALSDPRYTAMWSMAQVANWRQMTEDDNAVYVPSRFQFDTNNRLFMAPQKNGTYANAGANFVAGGIRYDIPDQSTRQITGVSFDYAFLCPVSWLAGLSTLPGGGTIWSLAGTGALQTGCINITFAADNVLQFFLYFNAAAAVYAGETGANYLKITNIRAVTSTTNRISTTFTANRAAGASVTATVGSTARMYAGQSLQIDNGTATGESVTVQSVTNTTQFVATFAKNHVIGGTIAAHVIYADEIVKDLVSVTNTLNSTQLLSDTSQVTSPSLDLLNETYEDAAPSAILDRLITLGDNATIPNQWEWGVTGLRVLYFRVAGAAALTWYVDVTGIQVQRSLNQLFNSVYAVYENASNRALRGTASTDSASVSQFAITRTQAVTASTTSLTQANVLRDATLADDADPAPRFSITFSAVYNAVGGRVPLWMPRAGDTLVIRNLPPTISVDIDQIRTFRIARTTCDLIARTLTIEPLTPLPSVQALLAQQAH